MAVVASIFAVDGFFERKDLVYRGFLKKRDTQDLQDFVQRMFQIQFLANDDHEDVDANRNRDLRLHGVPRSPIERLDPQMLLDPSKERFDLPATSVNVRNCQCGQAGGVLTSLNGRHRDPLSHCPDMIGQARRHRWRPLTSTSFADRLSQRPHRPAEVVAIDREIGHRHMHRPILRKRVGLPHLQGVVVPIRRVDSLDE